MKKIVVILMLLMLLPSLRAQDTVQYGDPWYAFNPLPILVPPNDYQLSNTRAFYNTCYQTNNRYFRFLQMYKNHDYTVYGIALTADTFPGEVYNAALTLTRCISFQSTPQLVPNVYTDEGPVTIYDSNWIDIKDYGIDDTLYTWLAMVRKCAFDYHFGYDTAINVVGNGKDTFITTNCYEFYFDEPISLGGCGKEASDNVISDAFFVGTMSCYSEDSVEFQRQLFNYYLGLDTTYSQYWLYAKYPDDEELSSYLSNLYPTYNRVASITHYPLSYYCGGPSLGYAGMWGIIFPIVKLRCVPPEVSLTEQGGRPMVKWQQYDLEAPEGYEVAIGAPGSDPDTCLVVELDGLQHTLSGLASGEQYAVWVRKSCRYTTAGYDTIVWSDWSQPVTVGDTSAGGGSGIAEVVDGGVRVYPREGAVVVEASAETTVQQVAVHDMVGRQVASATLPREGGTVVLPMPTAGVYVVNIGTRPPHRVVVVR